LKKTNNSILLADDSKTFLMYVGLLVKRLGYHTYVAKDGVEAIKPAKEKKPSIIVLDYMMPRIDGSSCLSIIRKDEEIGNTPVINSYFLRQRVDTGGISEDGCLQFSEETNQRYGIAQCYQ
jgi:CheY-like chemotaxis protein